MDRSQAQALAASLPKLAPQDAFRRGLDLLNADYPEVLIPPATRLFRRNPSDSRLAQLLGLAARAAGDGPLACRAFSRAAELAPHDPLIAHSHARTMLEAGKPASALFEHAQRLAPADGTILQGRAAALLAENRGALAIPFLRDVLTANPLWIDGHRTYAHIAAQLGHDPLAAIDAALAGAPANGDLHRQRINTLLEARRIAEVPAAIAAAVRATGKQPWLTFMAGHAASELGNITTADREFAASPAPGGAGDASLLARHMIKAGRAARARTLLNAWLGQPGEDVLWPYRALAWRLTGDARADWLEAAPALVGVYDLGNRIADLPGLAAHLRTLHTTLAAPLDQSVRGGTQTDGNLFLRDEPPLQALREAVMETVAEHVARLPAPERSHPTLISRRGPLRIAGSWSVRLAGAGFHTDHVHTQGWLSSALYLALPEQSGSPASSNPHAGWLSLGESRDLVPDLPPRRLVEPRPGRLVLFPSTMWHGTRPFPTGERLTVAFDIARPKQD